MFPGMQIAVVVASYLVGCVTAGYYLVRLLAKKDIHEMGSGNVGARNVGRILGPAGFVATLAIDLLKGALVVWAARRLGVGPYWLIAAYLAVIVGHVWPVQFRFRGGKGIATAIGVMLTLNPLIILFVIIPFLCIFAVTRSLTVSGLSAFAITPFTLFFFGQPVVYAIGVAALTVLVLFSHRKDIAGRFKRS